MPLPGFVFGVVKDASNNDLISEGTVKLTGSSPTKFSSGFFARVAPSGNYKVTVAADGYIAKENPSVDVNSGQAVPVSFALDPN